MRTGFTRMALTPPEAAPIASPCRPMRNCNQLSETLHDSRGSPGDPAGDGDEVSPEGFGDDGSVDTESE